MASKKWVMSHVTLDAGIPHPDPGDYGGDYDNLAFVLARKEWKALMEHAKKKAYRLGIGEWWSDYMGVKYTTPKDPKYKDTIFILPRRMGYKGKEIIIGNRSEYPPRNIHWQYQNRGDEVGYGGYTQKRFTDLNYQPYRYGYYPSAKSAREAVSAYLSFMEENNIQPLPSSTLHVSEKPLTNEKKEDYRWGRFEWVSSKEQYDILKQNGWKDGERIWKSKDEEGNTTYSVMKQDWDEYQSTLPMTLEQQRKIAHLYARIVFYGGYGILNMLDEGIMFEARDDIVSYH